MKEKIALGLGNNIDYELVWDSKILEGLIAEYKICDKELSADIEVTDERDLTVSILGFLKSESGGERFVSSPDIIKKFVNRFRYTITMGGTSARAAAAMGKLGHTAALHLVTMNDHVRKLLPEGCPYVCSAKEEGIYPHMIIQFSQNTVVKASDIEIHTSRSNRIIYVNDKDNAEMELNEDFSGLITDADVFLISGFNAMQSVALLDKRLVTLQHIISSLPKEAYVFYEDACFHNHSIGKRVRDALVGKIDIYSLNEDELQGYLGRKLDLLDPAAMADALYDIRQMIPVPLIVVHTRHWALAYGENAGDFEKALKGGITMAGTRYRYGDDFTAEHYNDMMQSDLQPEGVAFAAGLSRLLGGRVCCLACIRVEETDPTTIGLGDAFVGGFLPEVCYHL